MFFIREVCDSSSILKVIYYAKEIIKIIFILVPIGLILMTSIDITKNVIIKEEDMKKNFSLSSKRIFMAVVLFFVPTVVGIFNSLVEESINGKFLYNECLENSNKSYIKDMENEELVLKKEEELNRKSSNVSDISNTPVYNPTASMTGQSLPEDDKYYPLDGKDANGNKLDYLEIDGKFLTENDMQQINNFIWDSIEKSDDWGMRVATAGWALAYSLSQKGLRMHYGKAQWANDYKTNQSIGRVKLCAMNGYCENWGRLLNSKSITEICGKYGYVNFQGDCSSSKKNQKKYVGLDCTGFVKWSIRTGCGTTDITDSQYQSNRKLFPRTSNLDEAKAGDILITTGHVIMFLKKNKDGTYMTVESGSGGANGLYFHKYTASGLKRYEVIKMTNGYNTYCKKKS